MLEKIISGGQTGVDRAALDAAITMQIQHGGYCPKNRWAEDGRISEKYSLIETEASEPAIRTKLNIQQADGTLVIIKTEPVGEGTELTILEASRLKKPLFVYHLLKQNDPTLVIRWLSENDITTLNIAGPRASQSDQIYEKTYTFLIDSLLPLVIRQTATPCCT